MKPKILMENFKYFDKTCPKNGTCPKPFLFIYGVFPKGQILQYIGHDVKHMLQRLGASRSIY
jgi:hypothetical protein